MILCWLFWIVTSAFMPAFPRDNSFVDRERPSHFEVISRTAIALLHIILDLPEGVCGVASGKIFISHVPVRSTIESVQQRLKAPKTHPLLDPTLSKNPPHPPNDFAILYFHNTQVNTNTNEAVHFCVCGRLPIRKTGLVSEARMRRGSTIGPRHKFVHHRDRDEQLDKLKRRLTLAGDPSRSRLFLVPITTRRAIHCIIAIAFTSR